MKQHMLNVIAALVMMMFIGAFMLPSNTLATTWTQVHTTAFPSSNNATIAFDYGGGGTPQEDYGSHVIYDGLAWPDIFNHWNPITVTALADDFNNGTYVIGPFADPYTSNAVSPVNATIGNVFVVAVFSGTSPPIQTDAVRLSYSLNGIAFSGPYIPISSIFPGPLVFSWPTYQYVPVSAFSYNITGLETWTPSLLISSTMTAKLTLHVAALEGPYELDYLGIYYTWSYPGGSGGGGPVGPSGSFFPSFGGSWLVKILTIAMGFIGLVGMIAYPASAIKGYKKGTDPGGSFASALIIEFLFIGMLYAGLVMANLI